jgi:hypothetical protein
MQADQLTLGAGRASQQRMVFDEHGKFSWSGGRRSRKAHLHQYPEWQQSNNLPFTGEQIYPFKPESNGIFVQLNWTLPQINFD